MENLLKQKEGMIELHSFSINRRAEICLCQEGENTAKYKKMISLCYEVQPQAQQDLFKSETSKRKLLEQKPQIQ